MSQKWWLTKSAKPSLGFCRPMVWSTVSQTGAFWGCPPKDIGNAAVFLMISRGQNVTKNVMFNFKPKIKASLGEPYTK
jgi:hypothetical protein